MSERVLIICDACGLPIEQKPERTGEPAAHASDPFSVYMRATPLLTWGPEDGSPAKPKPKGVRVEAQHLHHGCRLLLDGAVRETVKRIREKVAEDTAALRAAFDAEEVAS